MKKVVVISVGGSIIVPDRVDYDFLRRLKATVKKLTRKYKIVICTGGGYTARNYISALKKSKCSENIQNRIGIAATRLNAQLLAFDFQNSNKEIPESLGEVRKLLKANDVVLCGGIRPGQTSDGTTAEIAEYVKADTLINMTNVSGLYTKDPRKYKDARLITKLTHAEFARIMSKVKEKPGQHFILDSVAARITRRRKIKVVILKGVKNLEDYLSGKKFKGTV
ncbi:MAG: UMP kinase, partial [archaeon]